MMQTKPVLYPLFSLNQKWDHNIFEALHWTPGFKRRVMWKNQFWPISSTPFQPSKWFQLFHCNSQACKTSRFSEYWVLREERHYYLWWLHLNQRYFIITSTRQSIWNVTCHVTPLTALYRKQNKPLMVCVCHGKTANYSTHLFVLCKGRLGHKDSVMQQPLVKMLGFVFLGVIRKVRFQWDLSDILLPLLKKGL